MSEPASLELLSVREFADVLHVSESAARRIISSGEVVSLRVGGAIKVPFEAVAAYIEKAFRRS